MSIVKGSTQYRSVVVPYRPQRRWLTVLIAIVVIAITAAISYSVSGMSVSHRYESVLDERNQLREQLADVQRELRDTQQALANIEMGSEVDRKAVDDVREVVREQKKEISSLTEEISFYKGLMAPTDREKGLSIRSWELYPTSDPRRFQFKLTVQQLATKHNLMTGEVKVSISGKQGETERTFSLDSLSEQVSSSNIRLRFKYFQSIEGELLLPTEFEPAAITVIAKVASPQSAQVEKNYSWIVQG